MRLLIVLLMTMSLGCVIMLKEQDIQNRGQAYCAGFCRANEMVVCKYKHRKLEKKASCVCCKKVDNRWPGSQAGKATGCNPVIVSSNLTRASNTPL